MRHVCTSIVGTALLRATGTRLGRPMRYNCILVATLLTFASAGLSERAYGEEWVVSASGGGQFEDIQSAVDIASDGDQITVLPGVYVGTGDYVAEIADKTLYIIVSFLPVPTGVGNHTVDRAIEFFMPVGQSGESQQWITSSMRLLSLAARGGCELLSTLAL